MFQQSRPSFKDSRMQDTDAVPATVGAKEKAASTRAVHTDKKEGAGAKGAKPDKTDAKPDRDGRKRARSSEPASDGRRKEARRSRERCGNLHVLLGRQLQTERQESHRWRSRCMTCSDSGYDSLRIRCLCKRLAAGQYIPRHIEITSEL